MSKASNHSLMFFAGLLVGTVTGSLVGLLLTPRTGRQLRHSLGHELKRAALRASALDLHDWAEVADEENRRNLVANIERIRAAGL